MINPTFEIVKTTVSAKTRKLKVSWTVETADDWFEPFSVAHEPKIINNEKWHVVSIHRNRISTWVESNNTDLWFTKGNSYYIHDKLFTMFLLKFGE